MSSPTVVHRLIRIEVLRPRIHFSARSTGGAMRCEMHDGKQRYVPDHEELGMSMTPEPHDAAHHHEAVGLETAHLRSAQIIALALTSQTPAVALATVPFLLVLTAGNGSWLGALIIAFTTACIGVSVITFARRYVGTGS